MKSLYMTGLFVSLFISVFNVFPAKRFSENNTTLVIFSGSKSTEDKTAQFTKIIFGCFSTDLSDFEEFVKVAKNAGATHIILTAEDLPCSHWQYDTPGDPYPAWVITNMGLLKICTPRALRPYVPQDYAEQVMRILEDRCRILRQYGMKGAMKTFEPQMLPEAVFTDQPLWRGPRVEHPMRSRAARFAPDIDNPEVLALYRESIARLIRRCPEIEMISFHTNDSGTGLSWSGGLYSGRSGNTRYKNRPMEDRLLDFFSALQAGANDAGGNLEIDILWTREPQPKTIAMKLKPGMAIENLEGPHATPYKATVGYLLDYFNFYYPVLGIPHVFRFINELEKAFQRPAPRLVVMLGDHINRDLYFQIYNRFCEKPATDEITRLQRLKEIAREQVGEENANSLVQIWLELAEVNKLADFVDTGGFIFYLGSVQQRWLTRPFVPFPEELSAEERDYYRKFQFQGRTEAHADDLVDLQGYRFYSGMSGNYFVGKILGRVRSQIQTARSHLTEIIKNSANPQKAKYELFDLRLNAFLCLVENAVNAVSYQAQLDRLKSLGYQSQFRKGQGPVWDREWILETARREIDNTALLMQLLKSTNEPIIDLATTPQESDIRFLEHNLLENLQKKLNIMNAHWLDYNRLFTINWLDP